MAELGSAFKWEGCWQEVGKTAEPSRAEVNSEIGGEQSESVCGVTRSLLVTGTSLDSFFSFFSDLAFREESHRMQLRSLWRRRGRRDTELQG